ncbi:MAG TPA: hypothetical protein VE782_12455 [Myxococcaceae bacterium]|nr:hypothetical protein [Myxococcaceae bacterium]
MLKKKKIGELLREAGAVEVEDVKRALGGQRSWGAGQKLGQLLVALGKVTPQQVARALAEQFALPYVEIPEIPASVSALVPIEFQAEHKVVPFRVECDGKAERLLVAVADPSNLELIDELSFQLARPIRVYVASSADIEAVVNALRGEIVGTIEPLELDEVEEDLVLDRSEGGLMAEGWFSTRREPAPEQGGSPGPGTPPHGPWAPPPALLPARDPSPPTGNPAFAGATGAAAELDDLLGVDTAAPTSVRFLRPHTNGPREMARPAAPSSAAPSRLPAVLSEEDRRLLLGLQRLSRGEPVSDSLKMAPAQMVASLIQLLLRKGVISDSELLGELRPSKSRDRFG